MEISNLKKIYKISDQLIFELSNQLSKTKWSDNSKIHFLSQCAHESAYFTRLSENLNYSAQALKAVFPRYFKNLDVNLYARKPEKIANIVYANRMGNGDTNSGDGWRYRGRGLIQITGKNNYESFGHSFDPEYLETAEGAVKSAIWYWNTNKLFNYEDITVLTKKINGGLNGIEDRKTQFTKIKNILGV